MAPATINKDLKDNPATKHLGELFEKMWEENEKSQIEEHCRINNITEHSVNVDGSCNMGCC